jgi:hypothetical protein
VSYAAGDRHPMGRNAVGVLDYSEDGKVSVHIMGEGYFAYYGDYVVDESRSTVTHHLEMASEPTYIGASNLRHASLDGPRLLLTGSTQFDGATREIRVLWERDKE